MFVRLNAVKATLCALLYAMLLVFAEGQRLPDILKIGRFAVPRVGERASPSGSLAFQIPKQDESPSNRQISTIPPPPPPRGYNAVPGALFDVVLPLQTTWSEEQSSALCAALIDVTFGYPKDVVQCKLNEVMPSEPSAAAPSISVAGQMWWPLYDGAPSGIQGIALQSRDRFIGSVRANTSILASSPLLPGSIVNNTCSPSFKFSWAAEWGTDYQNWPPIIPAPATSVSTSNGMPLTQCRTAAKLGYAEWWGAGAAPPIEQWVDGQCVSNLLFNSIYARRRLQSTPSIPKELCFSEGEPTTVFGIGVSNGKYCPAGEYSITPLTLGSGSLTSVTATYVPPLSGEELGTLHFSTPSAPANFVAGGDTSSLASGQSRVYLYFKDMLTFPAVGTCRYQLLGAYIASKLTGLDKTGREALNEYFSYNSVLVTGISGTAGGAATITVKVNIEAALACNLEGSWNVGGLELRQSWSPACDERYSFYQRFAQGTSVPTTNNIFGQACPRCGPASSPVLFQYNSTMAGEFCSSEVNSPQMIHPDIYPSALEGGTPCMAVGVANYGPGSYLTGTPMLYAADSAGTGFPASAVFPTLPDNSVLMPDFGAVPVATGSPPPSTASQVFAAIALDTQYNVPCSTPRMSKPPKGQQTVGINGDLVLDILCLYDVGACGAGSCNTVSRFWNGGTESSSSSSGSSGPSPGGGIPPNSYVAAILSTEFLAEYFTATAPTPAPAPAPVPAPSPSVCTYVGDYAVASKGCLDGDGRRDVFLASPSTTKCGNNVVALRTAAQVGTKQGRLRWRFSGDGRVIAASRVPACTSRSNLAGRDDSNTIKVGGVDWRWRIGRPSDASCDEVQLISLNRTANAALSTDRACTSFAWSDADDGVSTWVLRKM